MEKGQKINTDFADAFKLRKQMKHYFGWKY
jgi:hypothetical protein